MAVSPNSAPSGCTNESSPPPPMIFCIRWQQRARGKGFYTVLVLIDFRFDYYG